MKVLLEIQRPVNCFMAGAAAIVGLLIADGWNAEMAALIFLTAFLFTGAGNTINDYYDIEIDKINRPERPIPSGRLSSKEALALSIALFALGLVFASLINKICLSIAGLNSVLLILYARNLKVMPLIGNICISYLTGSTFLFGGAVYGFIGLQANSVPFLLSFLITMSREIAKDIEDLEGDRRGGARTVPIIVGERISSALVAIFSLGGIMLSYLAGLGIYYISVVSIANFLFLLAVVKILLDDASGSQKLLKLGMSVALMAFFVGSVYSI